MIVGSRYLGRLAPHTRVPVAALLVSSLLPALLALAGLWLTDAIATIISFAACGIYIAFQLLVLAALIARAKGWRPGGAFRLRAWAIPVNLGALIFGVGAIIDMMWPRAPKDPWFSNYGVLVGTATIVLTGTVYMLLAKPYDRGQAPAGDAHRIQPDGIRPRE
jgi:amino acid transporter